MPAWHQLNTPPTPTRLCPPTRAAPLLFKPLTSLRPSAPSQVLLTAFTSFAAIAVLLCLFWVVFSVVGMHVFGPLKLDHWSPWPNFNTFLFSLVSMFNVSAAPFCLLAALAPCLHLLQGHAHTAQPQALPGPVHARPALARQSTSSLQRLQHLTFPSVGPASPKHLAPPQTRPCGAPRRTPYLLRLPTCRP